MCPSDLGGALQLAAPQVHGAFQALEWCLLSSLQVNLVLGDGRSLGLTIRGGAEYGLGIYITGVDPGSEAESSGLKVRGAGAPGGVREGTFWAWSSLPLILVGLSAEQSAPTFALVPAGSPALPARL